MFSPSLVTAMIHALAFRGGLSREMSDARFDQVDLASFLKQVTRRGDIAARLPVVARTTLVQNAEAFGPFEAVESASAGLVFWGRFDLSTLADNYAANARVEVQREYIDLGTPTHRANIGSRHLRWTGTPSEREQPGALAIVVDCGDSKRGALPSNLDGQIEQIVTADIEMTQHAEQVLATLMDQLDKQNVLRDVLVACSLAKSKPSIHAPGLDVLEQDNVVEMLDAVRAAQTFIWDRNLPAVLNLSMGTHVGPHTGVSPVEQAISALVDPIRPTYVTVSAGNDGEQGIHAVCHLEDAAPDVMSVRVGSSGSKETLVEFWWEDRGDLDLEVKAYVTDAAGKNFFGGPAVIDSARPLSAAHLLSNGRGTQHSLIGAVAMNSLRCVSYGLSSVVAAELAGALIRFVLSAPNGAHVHAWLISRMDHNQPDNVTAFVAGDRNGTVTIPSTAAGAIGVGGYDEERVLWTHSSRGAGACPAGSGACWLSATARSPAVAHFARMPEANGMGTTMGTSFAAPRTCADALACILDPAKRERINATSDLVRELLGGKMGRWNPRVGYGRI
jgi:hypothetical protein